MKLKIISFCLISFLISSLTFAQEEKELDSLEQVKISNLALEKVRELTRYITIIGSKNTKREIANQTINVAMELFINEECLMGVSSLRNPDNIQYFSIKEYFNRLRMLKYSKVKIEYAEIKYESDLMKMPDNSYGGAVSFYQTFIAYNEEGIAYIDHTLKVSEVNVRSEKQIVNGVEVRYWNVFLGDIRVKETKP